MRLTWTATAIAHLSQIQEFVEQDKAEAAVALAERLIAHAEQLAEFPHLGRAGRKPDTRELVIPETPYIICYRAWRNQVVVLSVLHGAREHKDI